MSATSNIYMDGETSSEFNSDCGSVSAKSKQARDVKKAIDMISNEKSFHRQASKNSMLSQPGQKVLNDKLMDKLQREEIALEDEIMGIKDNK